MLLDGAQLGRYRIIRFMRRGGMSEIYLAQDTRLSRQVAIKIMQNEAGLYPDETTAQEASRLFKREMEIAANIYHPHILQLYDYGEESVNGTSFTYMVIPFHEQGSLADWLQRRGKTEPLSADDVIALILQAADALQYAHDRQIVHLDVKSSNFLVRTRKEKPTQPDLFLADFGIARMMATSKGSLAMRGTLEYMAPEQWDSQPTAASDQYSLAIMTYELLTGNAPFRGNMSQIMFKHFHETPQPPSQVNSHLSPSLDQVILRALAKKPEERFASITDFATALQREQQKSREIQQVHTQAGLRATLAISAEEASSGTQRTLTLPDARKVTISIPAGVADGYVLHLDEQGKVQLQQDLAETPLLTIAVHIEVASRASLDVEDDKKTLAVNFSPSPDPAFAFAGLVPPPPPSASIPATIPSISDSELNTATSKAGLRSTKRPISKVVVALLLVVLLISGLIGLDVHQNTVYRANIAGTATAVQNKTAIAIQNATGTAVEAPTATYTVAKSYPAYLSGSGTLAFYDALNKQNNWTEDAGTGYTCKFTRGAYHVSITKSNIFYDCDAPARYNNFAFQVNMTLVQGDCGGITFREDDSHSRFYAFDVCRDHMYYLYAYNPNPPANPLLSGTIQQLGLNNNQTNTIAVVARGSSINLYINYHQVDSISDSTFSNGYVGLIGLTNANTLTTEVAYSDAKVWTL